MTNRYDTAVTRFSPNGHLFQVDYAFEAANRGACALGVKTKDSVILGVERKVIPKLQESSTIKKISQIDSHLAMTYAGLTSDARQLIQGVVLKCQQYAFDYDQRPTVNYVAKYVANVKQEYTQVGGRRPFGILSLLIGFDQSKMPMLYLMEPSGSYSLWKAKAIGRGTKGAMEMLEKNYKDEINHEEGIKLAIEALMEVAEGGHKNIEVAFMKNDEKLTFLSEEDIKKVTDEIEKEKQPAVPGK